MTPEAQTKYNELRATLVVNLLRIDQEVATAAQRIQEAAELSIAATDEEASATSALKIITAEATARLRQVETGEKKKSDTQLDKEVPLEEDVQAAQEQVALAHTDAAMWRALVNAFQEKSHNIRKACDLIAAGFITPSSYAPRRTELMRPKG